MHEYESTSGVVFGHSLDLSVCLPVSIDVGLADRDDFVTIRFSKSVRNHGVETKRLTYDRIEEGEVVQLICGWLIGRNGSQLCTETILYILVAGEFQQTPCRLCAALCWRQS